MRATRAKEMAPGALLLACTEMQAGAPWGGAGNFVNALHESLLSRKGRLTKKQPQQRAWGLGLRTCAPASAGPEQGGASAPFAPPPAAAPVQVHPQPEEAYAQSALRPGGVASAWAAEAAAAAAMPAAGKPGAYKAALPKDYGGVVPQTLDSAGYVTQLESPWEVTEPPRATAPPPPRLEKLLPEDIRADASAAEQLRRGFVQSAFQPGTQPAPKRPGWAVRRPRTAQPLPVAQRRQWPAERLEAGPGLPISRASSITPRWAPVRCGQSIVRLQRAAAQSGGDTRVAISPPRGRQRKSGLGASSALGRASPPPELLPSPRPATSMGFCR